MKDDNQSLMKKVLVIGLILIIFGVVFVIFQNIAFSRSFEDFKGPGYVPAGYNNTDNLTNHNERIFEYGGNGTFYAGVIKNTAADELHDIMNPFEEDPESAVKKSENITVNGHNVAFQTSEYTLDLHGMDLTGMIPEGYNIPINRIHDININMAKFQATWYCKETNLIYIVTGLVTSDQLEEMKKMMMSVNCHPKKRIWNLL